MNESQSRRLIDVHHHILPGEYARALRKAGAKLPPTDWTSAGSLELMDAKSIVTAITSTSLFGTAFGGGGRRMARLCNESAAALRQEHPERFGVFATLPLPDIEAAIAEIDFAFDHIGVDGVTLMTNYDDKYLGDDAFSPVLDHLNRRSSVAFVHPAACTCNAVHPAAPISMLEFPFDTTRTILSLFLSGAFDAYPRIKFIFCHAGGTVPFLSYRIATMLQGQPSAERRWRTDFEGVLKRAYFDLTTAVSKPMLQALLSYVPVQNVLMGTDYPFVSASRISASIDGLSTLALSEPELDLIGRGNALRLFPRLAEMPRA